MHLYPINEKSGFPFAKLFLCFSFVSFLFNGSQNVFCRPLLSRVTLKRVTLEPGFYAIYAERLVRLDSLLVRVVYLAIWCPAYPFFFASN